MVCSSHVAEEVSQSVFLALAQNANRLTERAVLSGWLYRTTQNIAAQTVRTEVRRHAREQEVAAMNELPSNDHTPEWEHVAPHLEAAMGDLSEPDRDALLLRFFERKSAREMAQMLGTSEEAAQKRVHRALERLRTCFVKRGIPVSASGLAVVLTANAVQAAPAGLAIAITSLTTLAGTAISTTIATATKTAAMTTIQKTLITATLIASVGTGIYQTHQAYTLRNENQTIQQQQKPLLDRIQRLERDRSETSLRLSALADELEKANGNADELIKLREAMLRLKNASNELAKMKSAANKPTDDPAEIEMRDWMGRVKQLKQRLDENPNLKIPEFKLLTDEAWLNVTRFYTKRSQFDSETDFLVTAAEARQAAQNAFAGLAQKAFKDYERANNGAAPTDPAQLKPYFQPPIDEDILQRYTLVHAEQFGRKDKGQDWVLTQKELVDKQRDNPIWIGPIVWGYFMKP